MALLYVTLAVDAQQAIADLELLAQAAQRSLQVRQRLLDFLELSGESGCIHCEWDRARAADDCRVRFYLADPLAELVAAVRAGDFDVL